MREGSEAPEDDEGSKDEDLEGFRKEVMEKGAEGVDEETLEKWREGITDKEDGEGVGPREAGEDGEEADAKGEAAEARKDPEKGELDTGETQAEASPGKEINDQEKGTDEAPTETMDVKGEVEVDGGRLEASAKDQTTGGERQHSEQPDKPVQESDVGAQAELEKPQVIELDKPSQPESESYTKNDDQVLVIEHTSSGQEGDERAETPGLQRFQIQREREEEPRVLEAVDYGKGANVRVPMGDLEQAGYDPPDHNAILQLGLRPIEGDEVEAVYARYNTSDHRAEAYVGDIGGAKGSKYELVEAKGVDEDKIARDFGRGKCEHMQNARLEHEEGKMFLNVDGRQVELEGYKMSTSGAHLVLRGKLDGDDRCMVEFDGRRATVKFGRDYPVEEMKMEKDELVVKYAQSRNEKHEKRLYLEHLEAPERPSLNQFDRKEMLDHVKTFDHPERISGLYQFAADRESQSEVKRLLEDADKRGGKQYEIMKAEISERLVPNLLETCGWKRIERHPFSTKDKESASANGADWLMRAPDGKTVLMEVKWYEDRNQATGKATRQVGDDFRDHEDDPDLKLEGAYIAIVDYDPESNYGSPIRIHVLKVRPLEELA